MTALVVFTVFAVVYVANNFLPHAGFWFLAALAAGTAAGMLLLALLPNIYRLKTPVSVSPR